MSWWKKLFGQQSKPASKIATQFSPEVKPTPKPQQPVVATSAAASGSQPKPVIAGSKLKQYRPNEIKGIIILYNESITVNNADAVNKVVNSLLPLPLPVIDLIRSENVDLNNLALCIGKLYRGITDLGFNPVDPECVVEETFSVPGHSIKGRLYAYVSKTKEGSDTRTIAPERSVPKPSDNPLERLLAIGISPELCQRLYYNPENSSWFGGIEQVAGHGSIVIEGLYPLLQSHNDDLKLSAIAILLKLAIPPDPSLVDMLIATLSSDKSRIRYNSTKVLGKMNDTRAVEPLTRLMRGDPDQSVRETALQSIKALGAGAKVTPPDAPAISLSEIQNMTAQQRLNLLREVAKASTDNVNAPGHLNSYEKRKATARHIGELLNATGGFMLMRKTLEVDMGMMPGCRTIEGFWDGIGEWMG